MLATSHHCRAAVLLMTIERSIVITKPLTWNEILPRKRMLLFILCYWIAVVTSVALVINLILTGHTSVKIFTVHLVIPTLHSRFLLFTAAVNIYMSKKLRKKLDLLTVRKVRGSFLRLPVIKSPYILSIKHLY